MADLVPCQARRAQERPLASYDQIKLEEGVEEHPEDLAAQGSLRHLVELRVIFLQYAVFFKQMFPDHPIWGHPLFVRRDYLDFAQAVLKSMREVEEPASVRLRAVVPDLARQLNLNREDVVRTIDVQGQRIDSQNQRMHGLLETINRRLEDFVTVTGQLTFQLQPGPSTTSLAPGQIVLPAASSSSTTAFSPQSVPRTAAADVEAGSGSSPPQPILLDPNNVFLYVISRTVASVRDLWREWDD